MKEKIAPGSSASSQQSQRLDKWLWYTRIVKSRTLAGTLIEGGKVRVNRGRVSKASQTVRQGDVITATVAKKVRVLKVVELGRRRGPASEAQGLYEDLTSAEEVSTSRFGVRESTTGGNRITGVFEREAGAGRPTKRDRRMLDRLKNLKRDN